ncbi:uncharacterized protein LOC132255944 [Phlebotomus argentipes]|uniref:uncharacterized protein LOC132255944 n=1 Tax=Phlebotomus argentipes TaxID=94469 RepID=UPI0028935EF1|nr:uncharacterized protein LOC132255944 [Phlebotomus argentipes]
MGGVQVMKVLHFLIVLSCWRLSSGRIATAIDHDVSPLMEPCEIYVTGGLGEPQPLILNRDATEFVEPNSKTGIVRLNPGDVISLFCTNGFDSPAATDSLLTATCLTGNHFIIGGNKMSEMVFSDIVCKSYPYHTARLSGDKCADGEGVDIEVGFIVKELFIELYHICHDDIRESTLYVSHSMHPGADGYQSGFPRPSWLSSDFFGGKDANGIYTNVNQNAMVAKILGSQELADKFIQPTNTEVYLARGHLAAKVDFIYGSQQRATFWMMNVAPQWQKFNAGNWERVESSVRRMVSQRNLYLELYTGTHGVLTLPDVNGQQQEIYLHFDENNNGQIPVPKLYYRVIYDRSTEKGIVLIGVNNIHVTLDEIESQGYIVCEDVADEIDWINWDRSNLLLGYSYACEVNEFKQVVGHLPDIKVTVLSHSYGVRGEELLDYDAEMEAVEEPPVENENERPSVNAQCSILWFNVGDPQPLFLRPNTSEFFLPTASNGIMRLSAGEQIELFCSTHFPLFGTNVQTIFATCVSADTFSVNGAHHQISRLTCSGYPTHTARNTGRQCHGSGSRLTEIGFAVRERFFHLFDVCHNTGTSTTFYTHFWLRPGNQGFQRGFPRPPFIQYDHFPSDLNVNLMYTRNRQRQTIAGILGSQNLADDLIHPTNDYFLARGHMAARADFIFGNHQRASFYFINAAPQWQTFNGGNWERIEDGVRRFVADRGIEVEVYTGVWGVLHMADVNGNPQPLFLVPDATNPRIPVPKFYYKVVFEPRTSSAIVFIGVNNPYATRQEITDEYMLCRDVGDRVNWLNWDRERLSLGFSYACEWHDFVRVVDHLPNLSVTRLLI